MAGMAGMGSHTMLLVCVEEGGVQSSALSPQLPFFFICFSSIKSLVYHTGNRYWRTRIRETSLPSGKRGDTDPLKIGRTSFSDAKFTEPQLKNAVVCDRNELLTYDLRLHLTQKLLLPSHQLLSCGRRRFHRNGSFFQNLVSPTSKAECLSSCDTWFTVLKPKQHR